MYETPTLPRRSMGLFVAAVALLSGQPVLAQSGNPTVQGEDEGRKSRTGFVAVPMPDYNDVQGFGLGVLASYFYRTARADSLSPPSATAAFGFYAENKTWVAGVGQVLHLKQDTYRALAVVGGGGINYQFFVGDRAVPYRTEAFYARVNGRRRIASNLFLGAQYRYMSTSTRLTLGDDLSPGEGTDPELLERAKEKSGLDSLSNFRPFSGLGIVSEFDTRDNTLNAHSGWYVDFEALFNATWLGSTLAYQTYELAGHKFFPLGDRHTIATRLSVNVAAGDVPFEGQYILGRREDMRGYNQGRHRGDQLFAAQAEWRWNFWRRFGAVGFTGVAWVQDELSEFLMEDALPMVGFGARWMAVPDEGINVGVDVAWGQDDSSISITLTEVF